MKRGRSVQVAIVALTVAATMAYSLARHDVVARPRVAVMTVTSTAGATSTIAVAETTGGAVAIDGTARAPWCDPEVTSTPSAFVLGAGVAQDIRVSCTPLPYYTARRCMFEARDGSAAIVAYTGVCLARGTSALTPSTLAVSMLARPGAVSTSHAVAFTTPVEMSSASVQIDDQDGIFAVQTPCDTPEGCSDFAEPTSAHAAFALAFSCRPQDTGPHSAHAYVITDTGAEASVRLDCNVTAPALPPAFPEGGLGSDAPILDGPPDSAFDAPGSDAPGSDAPGSDAPGSDAPGSDAPASDASGLGDASVDAGGSMISVLPAIVTVTAPAGGSNSGDITFTETGMASVTINSVVVSGPGASAWTIVPQTPCVTLPCTLGAGSGAIFKAVYQPTLPNKADVAVATFTSSDPTSPTAIMLDGMSTPGDATISLVSANPVDFGVVQVNATGQLSFVLANTGMQALGNIQYVPPAAPFTLDLAPTTIAGQGQATGKVSCHPTAPGTYTGVVHIAAPDAVTGSPIDLMLTCATPPKLTASPTAVTLSMPVNTLGTAAIGLANQGGAELSISNVSIVGSTWGFALGTPCGATTCMLAANQTASVQLMFSPTMIGAANATLVIASNDPATPMLSIPLDGTGLGATLALHAGTPSTLDLGSVVVNNSATRSFQLDNGGNIALGNVAYDLMAPMGGLSLVSPPPTVPTTGATVTVRCSPTAVMAYSGMLMISSLDAISGSPVFLNVTCAGITGSTGPQLAVSPDAVAVMAPVGSPDAVPLDLANTGGMALTISPMVLAGSARWTLGSPCSSGCVLTSGQHVAATVTYTAQAIGASDGAMLSIPSDDPAGTKVVLLTGTGQGATFAVASGTPNPLDFGTVQLGASVQQSVQLQNAGNIQLTGVTYDALGGAFTLDPAPTTIDVGAPATVRISCAPTAVGPASATLTIHAPNAIGNQVATVPLTCIGQSGGLAAFPGSLDFGEIRAGTTAPVRRVVALSSTGSALTLTAQPMLTVPVDHLVVGTVATTTITSTPVPFDVTYTPPAQDTSFASSIVATASNTVTVVVTGKVVTAAVDPGATTTVDAGTWCLGQATGPTTVALHSTGTATLHVAQPTLGASSPFTLTDTMPAMAGYPYALPSQGTATVAVTPAPRTTVGTVTDNLAWNVDLPAPVITPITAEFVDDRGIATPTTLAYDTVINMASEVQLVTLQNCLAQPLAFASATVTPDDVFTIDTPPPASLPPGVRGAIGVSFHPKHAGVIAGKLEIATASGPITVALDAVGRGGVGTSGTPETFYGCGCRSSDRGAPLFVLVVLFVVRRRTRR